METVEEKVDAKADVNLDLVTVEKVDEANALETEEKVGVLNVEAVSETEKKVEAVSEIVVADLLTAKKVVVTLLLEQSAHAMPT